MLVVMLSVAFVSLSVCLSLCVCCKMKVALAISTIVGKDVVHGRSWACADPDVKRSQWIGERCGSAFRYECTFF